MAKIKISDSEQVTQHIQKLNPELGSVVERLRQIILATDPLIGEQIKWNSPAFYYTGPMQPFDPKEYKRDIIVMNLHRGRLLLIFPTGSKIKDSSGLLEGDFKDGRKMIAFTNLEGVLSREKDLQNIILDWLEQVE